MFFLDDVLVFQICCLFSEVRFCFAFCDGCLEWLGQTISKVGAAWLFQGLFLPFLGGK